MCFPRRGLLLVWETDYFEANWQDYFWGDNYARLKRISKNTTPTASSSSITAWAARTGAPTDSPGSKLGESKRGINVWRGLATVPTNRWGW